MNKKNSGKLNIVKLISGLKKSSKGSALVTVIVIVAFISILATTILYLAGTNFKMKIVDNKTKESFYEAEEVVELVESCIINDVAKATTTAYSNTAYRYIELSDEANRRQYFLTEFNKAFEENWRNHFKDTNPDASLDNSVQNGIKGWSTPTAGSDGGILEGASSIAFISTEYDAKSYNPTTGIAHFKITINGATYDCIINEYSTSVFSTNPASSTAFKYADAIKVPATVFDSSNNVNKTFIENLKVTITDGNDYTSVIKTSFAITPPELNWDSNSALSASPTSTTAIDKVDFSDCVAYLNWSKE